MCQPIRFSEGHRLQGQPDPWGFPRIHSLERRRLCPQSFSPDSSLREQPGRSLRSLSGWQKQWKQGQHRGVTQTDTGDSDRTFDTWGHALPVSSGTRCQGTGLRLNFRQTTKRVSAKSVPSLH